MPFLLGLVVVVALRRVLTVLDVELDPLAVVRHSDGHCKSPFPRLYTD